MRHRANTSSACCVPAFEPLEPRVLLAGHALITEFMADNATTRVDGDGNFSDWIEIHNPTPGALNLAGWYLTDDLADPDRWRFGDLTIAPAESAIVFASGQDVDDYVDPLGYLHTNFRLNDAGESLALVKPDGQTVVQAYRHYPQQFPDISYGITGLDTVQQTLVSAASTLTYHVPTAGEDPTAWAATSFNDGDWLDSFTVNAAGVLITEIATGPTRAVEVQNVSGGRVVTVRWSVLVNDASGGINAVNATAWTLGDYIEPGQVLYRSDDAGDGNYWGEPIDWGAEGPGWAMIVNGAGQVMDFVAWGYKAQEIAGLNVSHGSFTGITAAGRWSGDGTAPGPSKAASPPPAGWPSTTTPRAAERTRTPPPSAATRRPRAC